MKTKILLLIAITMLLACKKGFLDERPSTDIAAPTTLELMTKLLDNGKNCISNSINIASCDDYYIDGSNSWQNLTVMNRNAYIWKPDIYEGAINIADWNFQYNGILNANVVLDALALISIPPSDRLDAEYIKGWALFTRAWALNQLVQTFSPAYNPPTAKTDLGMPLKLSPYVDEVKQRATVQNTYDQIFKDLKEAIPLLKNNFQSENPNRPAKISAYALLSRIYLSMRDYENAGKYADSCLKINDTLLDFNKLSKTSTNPFANNIQEYLFFSHSSSDWSIALYSNRTNFLCVDSTLYDQYNNEDLRKAIYFQFNPRGKPYQKKINPFGPTPFGGLSTGEIYLIKAETAARTDQPEIAKRYLNRLLEKRWTTGKYLPVTTSDPQLLLDIILKERRKELVFKGLRWSDIKRLNLEGRNISLRRVINGQEYILEPNSPRYVLPIPDEEVTRSGIQQNIR